MQYSHFITERPVCLVLTLWWLTVHYARLLSHASACSNSLFILARVRYSRSVEAVAKHSLHTSARWLILNKQQWIAPVVLEQNVDVDVAAFRPYSVDLVPDNTRSSSVLRTPNFPATEVADTCLSAEQKCSTAYASYSKVSSSAVSSSAVSSSARCLQLLDSNQLISEIEARDISLQQLGMNILTLLS